MSDNLAKDQKPDESRTAPGVRVDEEEPQKIVGRSRAIRDVFRQIRQAASTDVPVLITGETGTGKDLAAYAIHQQSARAEGPYVAVHLGALPPELVASELFGHERGAFTGAMERREGKFEQAHRGTIFLDEISTVDEKVQISLLRLLEQKKFTRLGGKKVRSSDVRIIAATNEDLESAVERGAFRQDLYFRLDVFHILLPPLRDRPSDIPILIDEFLQRYNRAFDKHIRGIAPECLSLLDAHDWPGNVRELKNVIQRAVLVCPGETLLPEHLPPRLRDEGPDQATITVQIGTPLHEIERKVILKALSVSESRTRAAQLLGISRRALYNKLKKHSIE